METKKPFILYKFATRSRPEKFFKGIENIISRSSDKENMAILVSADIDDKTMYNSAVLTRLKPYIEKQIVFIVFGKSKNKIDAINRDMEQSYKIDRLKDWSILVNFSDDMEFIVDGFDEIIRDKFQIHFSTGDGNLHFNDGFAHDRVSTMSIMDRKYYERFHYIYNYAYISVWCDNEYTEVARMLNKIQYFSTQIFRHNHPANGIGTPDALLTHTESFYHVDGKTYEERKRKNFYINI
jgi:hypothetical protein